MTVNKRKKNSRQRGSWTHGWGEKKKHRGAGHRGGRGMSGSGKRADQKKPSIWKERYFGKLGFKFKGAKEDIKPVNIKDIETKIEKFVASKLAVEKNGVYEIDVTKLGFNKVLGTGKLSKKLKVHSPMFSEKAKIKITESGGEAIEITKEKVELKQEKENKGMKKEFKEKTDEIEAPAQDQKEVEAKK